MSTPADDKIFAKFRELCETPSDINLHLPVLKSYADKCESVCEMGVRGCCSLHAFLASNASKVVAYDIQDVWVPDVPKLTFICADVLKVDIEPTDLLMIDTYHAYQQLRVELARHSPQVRKWIAMHDTEMFGVTGEGGDYGLLIAIDEFLAENPQWKICYQTKVNNGLTILERV